MPFKSIPLPLILCLPLLSLGLGFVTPESAHAAEVYHVIAVDDLELTEGSLADDDPRRRMWWRFRRNRTRVVLDGPGEAFLEGPGQTPDEDARHGVIAVRAPAGEDITGRIYVPDVTPDQKRTALRFRIAADTEATDPREFHRIVRRHYDRLLRTDRPGAAWFRHRAREARRAEGADDADAPITGQTPRARPVTGDLARSYEMMTGGRAISENLQLDRQFLGLEPGDDEKRVELSSLEGITVNAYDWEGRTAEIDPELDPLAAFVPEDCHAVFLPSFNALTTLVDEAKANGAPVLGVIEPRVEDAHTLERYETQLSLTLNEVTRVLGPTVISEIALTGSDPYLRTGSDVAVLFHAVPGATPILEAFLKGQQQTAISQGTAKADDGRIGDVPYSGARSKDRSICTYSMRLADNVLVVANSKPLLERLAGVAAGEHDALASSLEYKFFRHRYPRGKDDQGNPGETGYVMITDATIRRWCSPRWRIAASRRLRAAALLSEVRASRIEADYRDSSVVLPSDLLGGSLGDVTMSKDGASSSIYGNLGFLTPVAELSMETVTESEADAYRRWKSGYERNWRTFFDPIAIRFLVKDQKIDADITVLPLIGGSSYRQFVNLSSGAEIAPDAGDRHAGSLLHVTMAINSDSQSFRMADGFMRGIAPSGGANPLAWLGSSASLYVDRSAVWADLATAENKMEFMREQLGRLAIALHFEVKSPLRLAGFLTALRAFVNQTAPGMTFWENIEHQEATFVKITANEEFGLDEFNDPALYYVALPGSLTLSFDEQTIRRAIDRHYARKNADEDQPSPDAPEELELLGKSATLEISREGIPVLQDIYNESWNEEMRRRAFTAIPILNEWKRHFGREDDDFDAVAFHDENWGVRILCPAGGAFIWNFEWETFESSVYGHPGDPKDGPDVPPAMKRFQRANFGITFEDDGLRARAVLDVAR